MSEPNPADFRPEANGTGQAHISGCFCRKCRRARKLAKRIARNRQAEAGPEPIGAGIDPDPVEIALEPLQELPVIELSDATYPVPDQPTDADIDPSLRYVSPVEAPAKSLELDLAIEAAQQRLAERRQEDKGGTFTHKNPECPCPPCRARRRKAQALALVVTKDWEGIDSDKDGVINADLPILVPETDTPRARVAAWLEMRALEPDISIAEIARQLRCSPKTLNSSIQKAVEEGWLKFEDPLSRIDYQIIPKVVRNLNKFLDEGDKTVTLETAKGTIFKTYQESKGISDTPQTVLALKIEQPDGQEIKIVTGHVVGKPKQVNPDYEA